MPAVAVEDKDVGSCCYLFLLTLCKMGAGISAAILYSYWAASTVPIAVFMGVVGANTFISHTVGKPGIRCYMIMAVLYNIAWIMAIRDDDSRRPAMITGPNWWIYLILLINFALDCHMIKKTLHKWASKYTSKDLKKQYKALKR